jgi:hypothetical protein
MLFNDAMPTAEINLYIVERAVMIGPTCHEKDGTERMRSWPTPKIFSMEDGRKTT